MVGNWDMEQDSDRREEILREEERLVYRDTYLKHLPYEKNNLLSNVRRMKRKRGIKQMLKVNTSLPPIEPFFFSSHDFGEKERKELVVTC